MKIDLMKSRLEIDFCFVSWFRSKDYFATGTSCIFDVHKETAIRTALVP